MKVYREFKLKNGEKLIIRSEEPSDAEITLNVYKQKTKETKFLSRGEGDTFPSVDNFKECAQDYLDNEKACEVVAVYQNEIVGTGHIDWHGGKLRARHICELDMGILKDYWGLGIGGKIMQTLIDIAKEVGHEQIELSVVAENERAIKMYESFGFVATGRSPHAWKYEDGSYADMVFMVKPLISEFN